MVATRGPSKVSGGYWRCVFRLSTRRALHGVPVGAFLPDADAAELIFAKVEAALGLLARYDHRRFTRLARNTSGILVFGDFGGLGTWIQGGRIMRIREDYVLHSATSTAHVASTLVHESTHAWLWRLGFGYDEPQRARIEAICYRSEIAFARRLPDTEVLIEELEDELSRDPADFSEVTRRAQALADLRAVGAPAWLVRLVAFATRRSAVGDVPALLLVAVVFGLLAPRRSGQRHSA